MADWSDTTLWAAGGIWRVIQLIVVFLFMAGGPSAVTLLVWNRTVSFSFDQNKVNWPWHQAFAVSLSASVLFFACTLQLLYGGSASLGAIDLPILLWSIT